MTCARAMATAVTTFLQSAHRQAPLHLPLQALQEAASASAEAHRTGAFAVRQRKTRRRPEPT